MNSFYRCSALCLVVVMFFLCSCEDPRLAAGEQVFTGTCKVCHAQGINGAPIVGNKKMWGPRIEQGYETLVSHAQSGYGLMPARGGNEELTDEEIGSAVFYMISQLEK